MALNGPKSVYVALKKSFINAQASQFPNTCWGVTASFSLNSGSFIVNGGTSIQKNCFIGGNVNFLDLYDNNLFNVYSQSILHKNTTIKGKTDTLEGLKENVIVGRLVPAGTGLTKIDWDKQAKDQDKLRLEELKKQELENSNTTPEQTV